MDSKLLKAGITLFFLISLTMVAANEAQAQLEEPPVVKAPNPQTPLSEGVSNEYGLDLIVNNFGFGLGVHYGRYIGPFTAITFRSGITGIRDASEQTFQSFFTGNKIIPNKYKRAFGFPFLFGIKHRIFPEKIADNFRLFVNVGAGPAMAFTYPYVQDGNNNGFRDFVAIQAPGGGTFLSPAERVNDFFTGWKKGETHWGLNGEIKIGADLGSTFAGQTTIEFGYFFYYFKQGLQIMEPYKPYGYRAPQNGFPGTPIEKKDGERNPFNPSQKYFGTPQIKITIGGMW